MSRLDARLALVACAFLPVLACSSGADPALDPGGITGEDGERVGVTSDELVSVACPKVSGTDVRRSLVVTDPSILASFSFAKVMGQVRTSANVATTETNAGVFQRWMKTFGSTAAAGDCNDPDVDPNDYGLACPRAPELKLASVNPFPATSTVKFVPVALFNRFDLAPGSGANCGEYRIIYAMQSTSPSINGRAFIIFEAALPNPNPAAGIDACLPVARFWQGLTSDPDVASRGAKLVKFYMTGGAVAGFAPVVRAAHYGLHTNAGAATAGQIRTNFFVDFAEWHLREFKTQRVCTNAADPATCTLAFDHVTVKNNPAEELFAGTHARSNAFLTAFPNQVAPLAAATVPGIRMGTQNQFNEFESVSQASNVVYKNVDSAAMRGAIQTKLTSLRSTLTVDNILDRATTQTCAGCHQLSNGVNLGGGLVWPSSLGFVQVDERGNLAPALTDATRGFLPQRKRVLEKFINARCTGSGPVVAVPAEDPAVTLGGSALDAPN